MKKQLVVFIGIVVVVLVAWLWYGGGYLEKDSFKNVDIVENGDRTAVTTEGNVMMKGGTYENYAPEKISTSAEKGNVVLFFRANWCPICRGLDADIKRNMGSIPENLTILDVDYDNSPELRKRYGVTYQHTMVQVDKDGNMIKKWMGSPTLAAFIKEIK